jgi:hypothetical protein
MTSQLFQKRELKRKFLGLRNERPKAESGRALVLAGDGVFTVLHPGQKITQGESVWGRFNTLYEVDISPKDFSFSDNVPAKGGVMEFRINFAANYQVADPVEVVKQGIQDPVPMLRRVLIDTIGTVTEEYDIENSEAARKAVRQKLEKGIGKKMPFVIDTIQFKLEPDSEAKEYLKELRRQQRKATLITKSTQVIEAEALIDKLNRKTRLEGEAELQKHYESVLDKGITGILVQQLAQNPENAPQVTNFLLQLHQQDVQGKVKILQTMVEKDMIEDWQLQEVVDSVVKNAATGVLGITPRLETTAAQKKLIDSSQAEQGEEASSSSED